nr:MAG TPA: hypothetical protein [Caudoviricetes sp.]DAT78898.1 MAG TPA: hypothetical protein [Caudoviricetes sp.]
MWKQPTGAISGHSFLKPFKRPLKLPQATIPTSNPM